MWLCSQLLFPFRVTLSLGNCPTALGRPLLPTGPCPQGGGGWGTSPHLVLCLPLSLANVVSNNPLCFLTESGEVGQLS